MDGDPEGLVGSIGLKRFALEGSCEELEHPYRL
jgi:hypothetical protein